MRQQITLIVIGATLGSALAAQQGTISPTEQPPKLPAPRVVHNPKLDAAPPADAATKAKNKANLQAQFAGVKKVTSAVNLEAQKAQAGSPESRTLAQQRAFAQNAKAQMGGVKTTSGQGKVLNASPNPLPASPAPRTQQPVGGTQSAAPGVKGAKNSGAPGNTYGTLPNSGTVQAAPTSPQPNPILVEPNAKICRTGKIYSVNGKSSGVVFTPDPASNDYFIDGCMFGDQPGQVFLSGAITGGQIPMIVLNWTSTRIEAAFPVVSGALDGWPDLVVRPPGNPPITFPNNRFLAQRATVPLTRIPLNWARLANEKVFTFKYCQNSSQQYLCASESAWPIPNTAAIGVERNSGATIFPEEGSSFNPGQDVYDFSGLVPGFVVKRALTYWYTESITKCQTWAEGSYVGPISFNYSPPDRFLEPAISGHKVFVNWWVDHCSAKAWVVIPVGDFYSAGYSLEIDVEGPVGVDPLQGVH